MGVKAPHPLAFRVPGCEGNGDIVFDLDHPEHPMRWRYRKGRLLREIVYQLHPSGKGWLPMSLGSKRDAARAVAMAAH